VSTGKDFLRYFQKTLSKVRLKIMDNNISRETKRLRNLKNFKKSSDSELESLARKNIWFKQIAIADKFTETDEKHLAESLLDSYFENYTFENFHQLTMLSDLIYEEVLLKRVRDDINAISADENNKFISDKQIQSLHSIEDRVELLKVKLGIAKVNENKDDLTALEEMKEKFRIYQEFNRNEFELMVPQVCKKCGNEDVSMYLLRRRVKDFEVLRHPAFSGRWLWNKEIFKDLEEGKITKEQAARFQMTSCKYVEWALENKYKIVEIEGVSQEKIKEFISSNPYLNEQEKN